MNTTTFLDVLDRAKSLIEGSADLQALCLAKWNRTMTVEIGYRARREIAFSELPLALLTRPQVTGRERVRAGREGKHTIRIYAGFTQTDAAAGARHLIEFEEKLEDALTENNPFKDLALEAEVGESVNDEGTQPPAYFLVMQLHVLYRRNT